MKQIVRLVAAVLIATTSYAQSTINIDQELGARGGDRSSTKTPAQQTVEAVQESLHNSLRIGTIYGTYSWGERFSYYRTFVNAQTKEEHIFHLDTEVFDIPITLEEVKALSVTRGIDCFSIKIERIENQQQYSKDVGCNRTIQKLIGQVHTAVVSDELHAFIHKLPSGIYGNLMTQMIVNQPIEEDTEKSVVYKKIEAELQQRGIGIANALEQPLIYLNGETAFFKDINALEEEELISCQILTEVMATAVYGSRALHGVVIIETTKGKK